MLFGTIIGIIGTIIFEVLAFVIYAKLNVKKIWEKMENICNEDDEQMETIRKRKEL